MNPYEMIKTHLDQTVPFARFIGVRIDEVGPGHARTSLVQRPEVSNHIETMHAGAMFTLGEAASGGALAGGFADILLKLRPVAAKAEIEYLKIARGTLTAQARIDGDLPAIRATLASEGKVRFWVAVAITDEAGVDVVGMRVEWHVRMNA